MTEENKVTDENEIADENKIADENEIKKKAEVSPQKALARRLARNIFVLLVLVIAGLAALIIAILRYDSNIPLILFIVIGSLVGGSSIGSVFNVQRAKDQMAYEKMNGDKEFRRSFVGRMVSYCLCLVLVLVAGVSAYGLYEASYINGKARDIVKTEVSQAVFYTVADFDEHLAEENAFTKLFFIYRGKYKDYRNKMDEYAAADVAEVERLIAEIGPCKEITTNDAYFERAYLLYGIELDEKDSYQKWLKEKVSNYDVLEKHIEEFKAIMKKYYRVCSQCGGDGQVVKTCEDCQGVGKRVVTFYEFGDWGEKTYSTYECTDCDGRGKFLLGCGKCEGFGHYYDIEK